MFSLFRLSLFAAGVVLGLGAAQPASAASILIFGDGFGTSAASDLAATLTGLGHSVVNPGGGVPLTDADFIGIDTAWHVGSSAAYISSGTTPTALQNFLSAGGGLHLTGENAAFAGALNTALLDNLVNPFITDPTIIAGGTISDPTMIATGVSPSIADVLAVPNNIAGSSLGTIATGELLNVDAGNTFAVSSGGAVVGAVFGNVDVIIPGSRLSIIMDVNWLLNPASNQVIDNLQTFLQGGPEVVAMPEPGTALLLVTAGLFAAACRRRKPA